MYFIAILAVLALMQYRRSLFLQLQNDKWYEAFCNKLQVLAPNSHVAMLVAVLLPSLVVWLVLVTLGDTLWGLTALIIAIVVLIYSLGRGDYSSRFMQYRKAWEHNEPEKIPAILQAVEPQYVPHVEAGMAEYHVAARQVFIHAAFTRLFVVLFWFALAGPAAALLYRLLRLYQQDSEDSLAAMLIAIMEWPAVRVFGISVAFLGNFSSALGVWMSTALDVGLSARRVLCEVTLAALDLDMQWQSNEFVANHSFEQLSSMAQSETMTIEHLVKRCLVFAIVCIAIIHIVI